jgi:hypothetical protein
LATDWPDWGWSPTAESLVGRVAFSAAKVAGGAAPEAVEREGGGAEAEDLVQMLKVVAREEVAAARAVEVEVAVRVRPARGASAGAATRLLKLYMSWAAGVGAMARAMVAARVVLAKARTTRRCCTLLQAEAEEAGGAVVAAERLYTTCTTTTFVEEQPCTSASRICAEIVACRTRRNVSTVVRLRET